MSGKSALLLGASGLVGQHVLQLLLDGDEYSKVVILVRRPLSISHPKLEEVVTNFDHLEDVKDKFKVQDVFSCLGTTIKVAKSKAVMYKIDVEYPVQAAKLAKEMGATQYLVISSIGANKKSPTWYLRMKGDLEHRLREIGFSALHIFQPSLLLGDRKEFRLGERIGTFMYSILSFLFIGGLKKYKGIQASDVARGMYYSAQQHNVGVKIYPSDQIQRLAKQKLDL